MNKQNLYEEFLTLLFDETVAEYEKTGDFDFAQETRARIKLEAESALTGEQQEIAEEWHSDLCALTGTEERFLYLQAMRSCTALLRWLGVLV